MQKASFVTRVGVDKSINNANLRINANLLMPTNGKKEVADIENTMNGRYRVFAPSENPI
jgi:hypothetical protein